MTVNRKKVRPFSQTGSAVKQLYLEAFPPQERLPYWLLAVNSWRSSADFYAYYDENDFVGLAYIIADKRTYFILFLAVAQSHHSQGYGSQILQDLKRMAAQRPIVLTIEPLDQTASNSEERRRRLRFYERNGLRLTNHFYNEGKEMYQIMTTAEKLDLKAYRDLVKHTFLGLFSAEIK